MKLFWWSICFCRLVSWVLMKEKRRRRWKWRMRMWSRWSRNGTWEEQEEFLLQSYPPLPILSPLICLNNDLLPKLLVCLLGSLQRCQPASSSCFSINKKDNPPEFSPSGKFCLLLNVPCTIFPSKHLCYDTSIWSKNIYTLLSISPIFIWEYPRLMCMNYIYHLIFTT